MKHRIPLCAAVVLGGFLVAAAVGDPAPAKPAATHMNYTEKLATAEDAPKVSFDMVAVPGGEFLMGSPPTDPDRKPDEGPQVKVKVKPFWMAKTEISWDEFDLYFRLNNAQLEGADAAKDPAKKVDPAGPDAVSKPTMPYVDETYGHERDKHPAICMTHHAAMKYCEWLSKRTGKYYRLPTEAEWEYAARAGTTTPYGIKKDEKIDEYAWYKANSPDETHPRGTTYEGAKKKPNAFGLYDMQGNVMEWCLDHYVADAYTRFNANLKDGFSVGPAFKPTENKWFHVARGGHFKSEEKGLRLAARVASEKAWMRQDPQEPQSIWWLTTFDIIGFRVVRPVEDDDLKGLTSKVVKENDQIFSIK